ncbi:hypothetical protein BJ944DRAFT_243983 [Cunninghamella echinulata]|nr:hypothetical protein BJ944DRAFT_243983 [Cunninghamella echinulata]
MSSSNLEAVLSQIDKNEKQFIERLRKAVAIPSVSGDPSYRKDVFRMAEFLIKELEALGATVETRNPGKQDWQNTGLILDIPPVVLATLGNDPNKKTVLLYNHFDVQPALIEDGWNTDPFTLVENEKDQLVGRGTTDDKGPLLGWLNIIETHQQLGLELPVNLKFCLEGMEESGSEGLEKIIFDEADQYFKNVDCVCISDNYWLGTTCPAVTYGLRGCCYYHLTIEGPAADLHSGVFGGTIHEPMTDLVLLLAKLVDTNGKILIPGIYDKVLPLTEKEQKAYDGLSFKMQDLHDAVGNTINIHSTPEATLQHRWRYPSLSIHGIEKAFHQPGDKTVIPAKAIGKFSIRTVPDMQNDEITKLVKEYVLKQFDLLNSKNQCKIELTHAGDHWLSSPDHWNYVAAINAIKKVYNVQPDLTREGCSIPITLTFTNALKKNVLLLPLGRGDDGAHSINEKLDKSNYIKGTKVLGSYLYQVAEAKIE